MGDEVTIGHGSPRAVFRSASPSGSDDPYAGSSFVVELHADGLTVTRPVFMFSFDWDSLPGFFADLAASWRGWDGIKTWESIEHDLTIKATSDRLGHCILEFVVRDGPVHTWQTQVGGFSIPAGEDMASIAKAMQEWAQGE